MVSVMLFWGFGFAALGLLVFKIAERMRGNRAAMAAHRGVQVR